MPTVSEIIKHLEGYKPDVHIAAHIWFEEDVLGRAEDTGFLCSQDKARDILDEIDRKVDSELGITWDTLDCYIEECCERKKTTK